MQNWDDYTFPQFFFSHINLTTQTVGYHGFLEEHTFSGQWPQIWWITLQAWLEISPPYVRTSKAIHACVLHPNGHQRGAMDERRVNYQKSGWGGSFSPIMAYLCCCVDNTSVPPYLFVATSYWRAIAATGRWHSEATRNRTLILSWTHCYYIWSKSSVLLDFDLSEINNLLLHLVQLLNFEQLLATNGISTIIRLSNIDCFHFWMCATRIYTKPRSKSVHFHYLFSYLSIFPNNLMLGGVTYLGFYLGVPVLD